MTVIIGFPLGLIRYFNTKKREQKDREYGTYNALDDKYVEYQLLCLKYPYLDIFDVKDTNSIKLDEKQKKEELIVFTILLSIFERAYLMYSDKSKKYVNCNGLAGIGISGNIAGETISKTP